MQQAKQSSSHWKKLTDDQPHGIFAAGGAFVPTQEKKKQKKTDDHEQTIMNPRAPEPAPQGTLEGTSHRSSWNSPNQHHDPTTPKHTHPNANKSPKPLKCPKRNNSRFFKSGNCENSFLPVCIVFGALFLNDCFKISVITRAHCSFIIFKVTQIFSAAILLLSYKQVF